MLFRFCEVLRVICAVVCRFWVVALRVCEVLCTVCEVLSVVCVVLCRLTTMVRSLYQR